MSVKLYRLKPELQYVTAQQFFRDEKPWPKGVVEIKSKDGRLTGPQLNNICVKDGDYILETGYGKLYSSNADEFESMYEPTEVPAKFSGNKEE